MFHLPSALKRTKSVVTGQKRQVDRRETKLQHVLGVSEADLNTARNQSVSSAATAKLQSNSLSDATTEAGQSSPQLDKAAAAAKLRSKASSVLLHDDIDGGAETSSSVHSIRLRNYDSSSTLHSHYDAHKAPLAVSQQTSDSSRRDFALRKGKPVVVKPKTAEEDSFRQIKLLKPSKGRDVTEQKKLTKSRQPVNLEDTHEPSTPTDWRSLVSLPSTPKTPKSTKSVGDNSQLYKGVRFRQPPPLPHVTRDIPFGNKKARNALLEPLDPSSVKVNVRRPKMGAKHWFDGHEDDSSEGEIIDEPEFQHNFVLGMESAFQNDEIKASSSDASTITTKPLSSAISFESNGTPHSQALPTMGYGQQLTYEEPPRIAVLSAKASKSNLSTISAAQSHKSRSNALADRDLSKSSVLSLSSDEEDDDLAPKARPRKAMAMPPKPMLRASVEDAFGTTASIELDTAKAMVAKQTNKTIEPPRIKHMRPLYQQPSREQLKMPIPKRGSSLMLSYLNKQYAAEPGSGDLLASFPATPADSLAPSRNTSVRSSAAVSDAGTVESKRLMSVTRQEESLLAAMRLKKAAMRYQTTQDKRLEALHELERDASRPSSKVPARPMMKSFPSQLSIGTPQAYVSARTSPRHHRRSLSGDDATRLRASGTTFQTTSSRNPSQMSRFTFGTDISTSTTPHATRLSLSSSNESSDSQSASHSLLSSSTADRRQSRDTYFSTSSASQYGGGGGGGGGHARTLTINSHIVDLNGLDQTPKRSGIPSQDFIDWPYKGWDERAELGLAR